MKGMVFTELVEFVEEQFGFEVADAMLEASMLEHKGAYTQAGNYPFEELGAIVMKLSQITGVDPQVLIETYGRHLFTRIVALYPPMTKNFTSSIPFIAQVETFIHPEVKKLYPDADLPTFDVVSQSSQELVIDYISTKPLIALARGLMMGSADYFGESIEVSHEVLPCESGTKARFRVSLNG